MIARFTRLLLLVQAGFAYGLYLLLRSAGGIDNAYLAAGLTIAVIVLLRLVITINNFILAQYYGSVTPAPHRLNRIQACRLLMAEFGATMLTSSWSMPFRAFAQTPAAIMVSEQSLPVLLVHGYACNSGYWTRMRDALLDNGIAHHAVDLEPMNASIDAYAPQLNAAIEKLCRETGHTHVIIVAHSMGGLATRAYLRVHGSTRLAAAITLGTPHHGSGLAKFAPGLNCRQMRWHGHCSEGKPSTWLLALAAQEDAALRSRFISIYSHQDNIVSPQTSSHFADARNIAFHGIGHVALGRDRRIIAQVMTEVRRISAAA
jgi:triacylglycerol lipase